MSVFITGAGPAGLTAALYCSRSNLKTFVFSSPDETSLLQKTTCIENFPGFDCISGYDLLERMKNQCKKYGTHFLDSHVEEYNFESEIKVKYKNRWYRTDALIIANGSYPKWLNLDNEDKFREGGRISSCAVCDGPLYKEKKVYVVGGGDTAAEDALFLSRFAKEVYILIRRDKMKASAILQDRIKENKKIKLLYNTRILKYIGSMREDGKHILTGLVLETNGTTYNVEADGLFVAIGHVPNTKPLMNTELELDDDGYIVVRNFVETNIRGVFAAGDVHDRIFRQAIVASGFGCMAAMKAQKYLEDKGLLK
jgi:thioredoxin reductase (NADPH)